MIKHVPNIITLINLFFGCICAIAIWRGEWSLFLFSFGMSLLADLLDGAVARALQVHSLLGKELDSLADAVSFGFIPGLIAFQMAERYNPGFWLNFSGFFITAASVYRLAKFNLDSRQSGGFLGLPTPANAIFWLGLGYLELSGQIPGFLASLPVLIILIILSSVLMLSEIKLIKLNSFSWGTPSGKLIVIMALFSIPLVIFLSLGALSIAIILYILLSLLIGTTSYTAFDKKN